MGKPKGRNGFYYYMLHKQKVLRDMGEDLPISHPKLQNIAGDEWKLMSKDERLPFDTKAKAEKERQTFSVPLRSYKEKQGQNLSHLMANTEEDETDRELYLDKMVECCVKACPTKEELMNASFFLISSNVMVKTDAGEYYPLEIGISQFTVKDGIKFTYHQFIDAGRVPMGYMHSAKSWGEASHKIPLDNFIASSNNYKKIVEDIAQVLGESRFTNEISGKPTPMMVYCMEPQIDQNKGVLKWLANKYKSVIKNDFDWDLEVMDLVNLVYHISKAGGQPISPAIAEKYLTTSAFDYSQNTNCEFHEEMDNKNCAKGGAKRLGYMLSQALCPIFDVRLTSSHLPGIRDVVVDTYKLNLTEVRPQPLNKYQRPKDEVTDEWAPTPDQRREQGTSSERFTPTIGVGRGRGRGVMAFDK